MNCTVKFRKIGPVEVPDPKPVHPGDAGVDLYAALKRNIWLENGERRLIPCGIQVEIPPGFEGQVRPRSGLARDKGLTVLNAPGTIDQTYRGEIGVILVNHGFDDVIILPLDRIAQLVIAPVPTVRWEAAEELSETERGERGFGSSGVAG